MAFVNFNINPKGRKTCDCVTRAIAQAAGIPWERVADIQFDIMKATMYGFTSTEVVTRVLERLGFKEVKYRPIKGTRRITAAELAEQSKNRETRRIVISVAGHLTCAVGGDYFDIWDCGKKAVYKYWTKEEDGPC